MEKLSHAEVINLLMQLGIMILFARLFGELARRFRQPIVLGEIIAGVMLGPSIFGMLSPELHAAFFPAVGDSSLVLDGVINISVVLLLFIAGLEVELDLVWLQGRRALITSVMSMIIPFSVGFMAVYLWPGAFGSIAGGQQLILALFLGTVLSITALPVIARILMDLDIFKSKLGMLIIASAMIVDILGWLIFSVILNMMNQDSGSLTTGQTILITLVFTFLMITVGKALINYSLPWINKNFAWPGGLLSIAMVICFLSAAFTEYIGIHAIFGAFIFGVALGDSQHMSERAKEIVHQFINSIFGPLFFVSIGLYVNFVTNFDLKLVLIIIVLAFISKLLGAYLGARIGGMGKYQSLAVGFGMNTHGALEVILGTIALTSGLISQALFVAIVIVVIISIIVSPPLMKGSLQLHKKYKKIKKKSRAAGGAGAILLLLAITVSCSAKKAVVSNAQPVDHSTLDALLKKHVFSDGTVEYKTFLQDRSQLQEYLVILGENPPDATNWGKEEQLSYWINAYNAFTIELILRHYPLQSIKEIGGSIQVPFINTPWDIPFIEIGGEKMDLNKIEHGILRKDYDEPRIHFAINCASLSCPRLRPEAYTPDKLERQLHEQAVEFINDSERNEIGRTEIRISKIFRWFGGDFTKEGSLIDYLNKYSRVKILPDADVEYLEYNWQLNDF